MNKIKAVFLLAVVFIFQALPAQRLGVTALNHEGFLRQVHNYKTNKEWKYLGTKPAIIDFYAVWCGPCKQLSPIVEEVAKAHPEIAVYKVNVDEQPELSDYFKISSIPVLVYIPLRGLPKSVIGFQSREEIEQQMVKVFGKRTK